MKKIILYVLLAFSTIVYSQGKRRSLLMQSRNTFLLDEYPNASVAYSLRYLSSDFVGSDVILVRRSSDNLELGFTPKEMVDYNIIGSELTYNGDFEIDNTGWSTPANGTITITGGIMTSTDPGNFTSINTGGLSAEVGKSYLLEFDILDGSGEWRLGIGGVNSSLASGAGHYMFKITAVSTARPTVVRLGAVGSVDNFTVKEYIPSTLEAWVGLWNDGFVNTWYDQSGNANNMIQLAPLVQSKIVDNGYLILNNGLPTLSITDSTAMVFADVSVNSSTSIAVFNPLLDPAFGIFSNFTNGVVPLAQSGSVSSILAGYVLDSIFVNGLTFSGNRGDLYNATTNQTNLVNCTIATNTIRAFFTRGGFTMVGYLQESIIWSSDETSNRTVIEDNINAYYSIY